MICTFTASRQYSEYVNIQARGDGGILQHMYHPTNKGTRVVGGAVYVNAFNPAEYSVTTPACSSFLAGEACTSQVALTKFSGVHKSCFDDCQWADINDPSSLMALGKSEVVAMLNSLLPLCYADMIANGTAVHTGSATPTAAQEATALLSCLAGIAAHGGGPGAIVFDLTEYGLMVAGLGAAFQPNFVQSGYGPNVIGFVAGFPCFVTPDNLTNTDATPLNVDAIVFAEMGFAYAATGQDPSLGVKIVPHEDDENGTNSVISKLCAGYKTLSANLVYYVLRTT